MKYLNKKFSVPGLNKEAWERVFGKKSKCCNAKVIKECYKSLEKKKSSKVFYYVCTNCQSECEIK